MFKMSSEVFHPTPLVCRERDTLKLAQVIGGIIAEIPLAPPGN